MAGKKELMLPDLFTLLDSVEWGVSIFDENGYFLWVNRYVLKCSGRSRKFYEGKSIHDFIELGIFDAPVCLKTFETKKMEAHLQRSYTESGKLRDFWVTSTPIFDSEGKIKYVVADRIEVESLKGRYDLAMKERKKVVVSTSKMEAKSYDLIYRSEVMRRLVEDVERAASVSSVILLQGESGTGKEVFAHYIHDKSRFASGPMIEINCASMPESLLESELFGYAKGAFTGALNTGKKGLIEAADGGTLFLDEINSMPLNLQAKLLRVLESHTITRIGETKSVKVDFRLVTATNRNLAECVEDKTFRADLYYRLNVIPITIPPLRDRKEDIGALTDFFLKKYCVKYELKKKFSKRVYKTFELYNWPGNVRELKNIVERLVIMSTAATITINEVPDGMLKAADFAEKMVDKEADEKARIERALELNHGHREMTASYLNISRRTLQYKLKKYGLK